ncbi:MAG TPA: FliA/WhiG family RNA polymerase sigma factor [Clostridia bacterium]|nr:FliA/WhiG family RNA polymerase sigma factor [Clostridia bacterium]
MTTLIESPPACVQEAKPVSQDMAARFYKVAPGSAAEEELVRSYLPLVKTLVGRIAMTLPAHVEADDLYSVGMVGLLNAVRNYDPKGGSSFESYARVRIRGAIFDELRRLDWVPRSVHEKARKVEAVIQELEQKKGALPTSEEIAKGLNLSMSEYEQLLEEIRPATFVCLDSVQTSEEGGDSARYESVADSSQSDPAETAARNELSRLILERLDQLPEMQKKVLALYYFEDLRLREIAEVFGVTESRICQIHAQAILAIKSFVRRRTDAAA